MKSSHLNQMSDEMVKNLKEMNEKMGTMYDLVHSVASGVNIVENQVALLKSQNQHGPPKEDISVSIEASVKPKDKKQSFIRAKNEDKEKDEVITL